MVVAEAERIVRLLSQDSFYFDIDCSMVYHLSDAKIRPSKQL